MVVYHEYFERAAFETDLPRRANFRLTPSLITNSFDPQLLRFPFRQATAADHHLICDGEQRNRLSD